MKFEFSFYDFMACVCLFGTMVFALFCQLNVAYVGLTISMALGTILNYFFSVENKYLNKGS